MISRIIRAIQVAWYKRKVARRLERANDIPVHNFTINENDETYLPHVYPMLTEDARILTSLGFIKAKDVDIGDTVLTDKGVAHVVALYGAFTYDDILDAQIIEEKQ